MATVALLIMACSLVYAVSGDVSPVIMTIGITAIGMRWYLRTRTPIVLVPVVFMNAALALLAWAFSKRLGS